MPMPPPPAAALSITGIADRAPPPPRAASTESTGPSLPGTTGTPAAAMSRRAAILSPICWITRQDGPTKISPAASQAWAKRQFSERKP